MTPEDSMGAFVKEVRARMKAQGVSCRELAAQIGSSEQAVRRRLRGAAVLSARDMFLMAGALGMEIEFEWAVSPCLAKNR